MSCSKGWSFAVVWRRKLFKCSLLQCTDMMCWTIVEKTSFVARLIHFGIPYLEPLEEKIACHRSFLIGCMSNHKVFHILKAVWRPALYNNKRPQFAWSIHICSNQNLCALCCWCCCFFVCFFFFTMTCTALQVQSCLAAFAKAVQSHLCWIFHHSPDNHFISLVLIASFA